MTTAEAIRDTFALYAAEVRRQREACACYATYDSDGVLHPEWCYRHRIEASAARIAFGHVTYERAFDNEADAQYRADLVIRLMLREDKFAQVVKVGRFWLVLATWGRRKSALEAIDLRTLGLLLGTGT